MKVAGGSYHTAVGPAVGKAATPGRVTGKLQQKFQHFPFRDDAGGNFVGSFGQFRNVAPFYRVGIGAFRQVKGRAGDDIGVGNQGRRLPLLYAVHGVAELGELTLQHGEGAGRYIAGNPLPPVALGGHRHIGAAGKAIQHDIAGPGAGQDDTLGQGDGFLGGVAGALPGLGVDGKYVRPDIARNQAGTGVQVALEPRDARL